MGREEEQAEHELRQAQPCPQVYSRQNQDNQAEKYKGRLFIVMINSEKTQYKKILNMDCFFYM